MSENSGSKKPRPLSNFRVHGQLIYVSGQVAVREGAIVTDGFEAQVRQTLENVKSAVLEAGGSLESILKCNCYLRHEEDVAHFNTLYAEFFGEGPYPARTTLIATPPTSTVLVEIDAIAAVS
jgi:2-iminobutanoate/2-iminopropanoate deaminase